MNLHPRPSLEGLNPLQKAVVSFKGQSALVLAGAGSGKTKVLTHRIAWIFEEENIPLSEIFAVTFTNKAANQLKLRVQALLGTEAPPQWVGTFHGLAYRMLKKHANLAGLSSDFQVIDAADQKRVIASIVKNEAANVKVKEENTESAEQAKRIKQTLECINRLKLQGLTPDAAVHEGDPSDRPYLRAFQAYQTECSRSALLDFADLLIKVNQLFATNLELKEAYQSKFKHCLIDEFQDTNPLQYQWIKRLIGPNTKVLAVGDDDQLVYEWRGANAHLFRKFLSEFPGTETFRLEQNYRSNASILVLANALISNNIQRLGKNLWTDQGKGEAVTLLGAHDDDAEAAYVIDKILANRRRKIPLKEQAILYRNKQQGTKFASQLQLLGVPFRIYGGESIFQRKSVKDLLAYLSLLLAPNNDHAFKRAIATPPRGIGPVALQQLENFAKEHECGLWNAMIAIIEDAQAPARLQQNLLGFLRVFEHVKIRFDGLPLIESIKLLYAESGLQAYLESKEASSAATAKGAPEQACVEKAFQEIEAFYQQNALEAENDNTRLLSNFLSNLALTQTEEGADPNLVDQVNLMTLHAAKGLEFDHVFLVGWEENLFPSTQSESDSAKLEEERRLAYVGITRARKALTISYAHKRYLYGKRQYSSPSCFLYELPSTQLRLEGKAKIAFGPRAPKSTLPAKPLSHIVHEYPKQASPPTAGQRVSHKIYGDGCIVGIKGSGLKATIQVAFDHHGLKSFYITTAPQYLTPLNTQP